MAIKKKTKEKAIIKPISFGSGDKLLLEYFLSQTNSSAYVRNLIEKDMREKNLPVSELEMIASSKADNKDHVVEEIITTETVTEARKRIRKVGSNTQEVDEETRESLSFIGR